MHLHRRYSYRRTLPHLQKNNHPIFVTFSTQKRWLLPENVRIHVLDSCLAEHQRVIELHAAVVMPDHVHLIFTALRETGGWIFSLPDIMRLIKGRSTHNINQTLGGAGAVWQDECFDHVLRGNESLREKVDYICQNPVRAGLVSGTENYPWLWRGGIPVI
jgi:REP element-mobilizing transposase RayT